MPKKVPKKLKIWGYFIKKEKFEFKKEMDFGKTDLVYLKIYLKIPLLLVVSGFFCFNIVPGPPLLVSRTPECNLK